jgi:hypothetical protein
LALEATEAEASVYATALAEACLPIMERPVSVPLCDLASMARGWLLYLERVADNPAARQAMLEKFGQGVRDDEAALRAVPLWQRVEAWHAAERARNPRFALRELMSELSEDAYCAGWHVDTEYSLWETLQGRRSAWMRLDGSDPRLGELRRLHLETGGWWWMSPKLDGGWGDLEFLPTETWEQVYAAMVDDKERRSCAVIDGKILRGDEAVAAVAKLLKLSSKKPRA